MLVESLIYVLSLPGTPAPFRRHLAESVGLWSRGVRQASAWAPHLAATRRFIEAGIAALPTRRAVAVLGSGPLFDVPLEALAASFGTVILIDRAHPLPVALRLRGHANVQCRWVELDAAPLPYVLDSHPALDWVISVNLLSQLAMAAPDGRERRAIDAHLGALRRLGCPATLITDTAYRILDAAGVERRRVDLLCGRAMPPVDASWDWEVAPFGEEARQVRRVHAVSAWHDWRKAAGAG